MFCKKCGKEVKDGATFCGHCGAPVNQAGGQKGGIPPMTVGYDGTTDPGSAAGNGSDNRIRNAMGKNPLMIAGAAVAALVVVIGLGIMLFSGKSDNIAGTWKWECGFGELADAFSDQVFVQEMENMGIKMSDFPDIRGTLEFDKDGKWEFSVDAEHYTKVALEAVEIMMDAVIEEGYMDEEEAKDYIEELKEQVKEEGVVEEELSVCGCSGTYEVNTKKGEIELTIKKMAGQKVSSEALLDYEINGKKLSLEVQEDEDHQMSIWENMGIFDEELTRK